MTTEGYKKKDIQRIRQPMELGASVSSDNMSSAADNQRLEFGTALEKMTIVTTGNLVVNVQAKIGNSDANVATAANTTASTVTTTNMFSAIEITYTSGEGKLLILAK